LVEHFNIYIYLIKLQLTNYKEILHDHFTKDKMIINTMIDWRNKKTREHTNHAY